MTDTFSPTRPCRYRNGDEPLAVFSLPSPTEHGDTLVSVSKSGRMCTHSVDGRVWCGQDCALDLINIPEEVTVEMWMIVNTLSDDRVGPFNTEEDALSKILHKRQEIVVRMTGSYTR